MTIPLDSKSGVLPQLFPILRDHTIGNVASLLLAAAAGGVFALLVGLPLMRLSGLAAGIATFAVLEITHNVLREWTKIGPGATTLALVPETTRALQATIGALVAIAVAFAYQRSRFGRMLRATREDAAAARRRRRERAPGASPRVHGLGRAGRVCRRRSSCTSWDRSRPSRSTSS